MKADARVIELLEKHGPATRREISEVLGMKPSAVSCVLTRIRNVLRTSAAGKRATGAPPPNGRPPRLYGLVDQ